MDEEMVPGEIPVSLNEARAWLRMGATIDDAVVAQLVRAATSICEAFIGRRLIARAAEEVVALRAGRADLGIRPVIAIDAVTRIADDGTESPVTPDAWRLAIAPDGTGRVILLSGATTERLRVVYRAGMAAGPNAVPEAIRQGIVRLVQHLHEARDGGGGAPPAAIAALWQPWRRLGLGSPA